MFTRNANLAKWVNPYPLFFLALRKHLSPSVEPPGPVHWEYFSEPREVLREVACDRAPLHAYDFNDGDARVLRPVINASQFAGREAA
jgi:hypothetical protein